MVLVLLLPINPKLSILSFLVTDHCAVDSGSALVVVMKNEEKKNVAAYVAGIGSHDLIACRERRKNVVVFTNVYSFKEWIIRRSTTFLENNTF